MLTDALRHHDQRRALLKRDAEQPDIMDDFADPNSDAVRSLYLDPDSSLPPHPLNDDLSRRAVSNGPVAALDSTESEHQRKGPLTPTAIAAEHVRNLLREGVVLRPLRLLPVGRVSPLSAEDQAFLRYARLNSYPVATPAVTLALTDAQDQVVVRKVLTPQMLDVPLFITPGALKTVVSDLNGLDPELAAVAGYRVMLFYP